MLQLARTLGFRLEPEGYDLVAISLALQQDPSPSDSIAHANHSA
jgi:hypothetical protein